ncbi:MAG TPA: MraY family glycosyltransferase [Nitrospinota bacterium]|jgi:UDP-GlcNAc:undecaprenyl-phosphate GlcNAc-1-phosphate transferase|nr:MraY family glycosyltransferase [Nitrospinota bacterium]
MNFVNLLTIGILIFLLAYKREPIEEFVMFKNIHWLYIVVSSFLLSYLIVPVMKEVAKKYSIYDIPDKRKLHGKPIPKLGGVAIYLAFFTVILINFHFSIQLKGILLGSAVIVAAGLFEDIYGLSAKKRLLSQILAVIILIICDVHLSFGPDTWWAFAIESFITMFWVVGIINAFNFLDGMDGLATGLAGISLFFIGVVALQSDQSYLVYLSFTVVGCCLGFLPFNFHPRKKASIFLGDTGSTFLGFILASLPVMTAWALDDPIKAYSMPILILGVLIFDMIYITIERIMTGKVKNLTEWIEYVGRDHFHHRLVATGLSNFDSVLFIFLLSATLGISALVLKHAETVDSFLLLVQAGSIYAILVILMLKSKKNLK